MSAPAIGLDRAIVLDGVALHVYMVVLAASGDEDLLDQLPLLLLLARRHLRPLLPLVLLPVCQSVPQNNTHRRHNAQDHVDADEVPQEKSIDLTLLRAKWLSCTNSCRLQKASKSTHRRRYPLGNRHGNRARGRASVGA